MRRTLRENLPTFNRTSLELKRVNIAQHEHEDVRLLIAPVWN